MKFSKKLAEKYNISVRSAKEYIKQGKVLFDGQRLKKDSDAMDGTLELFVSEDDTSFELNDFLISQDENTVFLDKPVFMHSERQKPDDPLTIEDIIKKHFPGYHLISRLDFSTDGIIAAVKDGCVPDRIKKIYLAWVSGSFKETVEADFLLDCAKRIKVKIIGEHGGSRTVFTPLKHENGMTLVKAEFEKAARHQLRAYLSHLGYPIIGDTLYGGPEFPRILLHCSETSVNSSHAFSQKTKTFIKLT